MISKIIQYQAKKTSSHSASIHVTYFNSKALQSTTGTAQFFCVRSKLIVSDFGRVNNWEDHCVADRVREG